VEPDEAEVGEAKMERGQGPRYGADKGNGHGAEPGVGEKPSWGGGTGWSQERMAAMAWKCEGLCNYSARPWWARTAVTREKRNEPLLTKINTSIHSHSFFPPTKHKQR